MRRRRRRREEVNRKKPNRWNGNFFGPSAVPEACRNQRFGAKLEEEGCDGE
jgi:hypothetical protein